MKRIWLVRHAESQANSGMRTSDPAEILLTPAGHVQAQKLATQFLEPPNLIVMSPFVRAKQTAQPLIKKYENIPYEEWDVHEFTYLAPSKCQKTTTHDRLPMVRKYWEANDPLYCDGVGAESFVAFIECVRLIVSRLRSRKEKFIAMFSHQQFILAVLWIIKNNPDSVISSESMQRYKNFLDSNKLANGEFAEVDIASLV